MSLRKANSREINEHGSKMRECDIFKLIELVKANPCVWNINIAEYSNETAKENTWKNICELLDGKYAEAVLRRKWSYLRSHFLVKVPLPTNHSSQEEVKLRKFFCEMDFLRKVGAAQWKRKLIRAFVAITIKSSTESLQPQIKRPRLTYDEPQLVSKAVFEEDVLKAFSEGGVECTNINKKICMALYNQLCSRSKSDAKKLRCRVTRAIKPNVE